MNCRNSLFFALITALPFSMQAAEQIGPAPVLLWSSGAPEATGATNEDKPAIYPYLASADKNTGAAVIVCPGGGFTHRAVDYEGVLEAQWFKARGINAFILRYRVRPVYEETVGTHDAQYAIQFLRAHAKEYKIDPERIGIIGFSAGGSLVQSTSLAPIAAKPDAPDPVERFGSRPNFAIYVYGSNRVDLDPTLGANAAPPSLMYGTEEDTGGLTGMLALYQKLVAAKVPVEAHFFTVGEHGTGFAIGDPVLGEWPVLMYNWIRANGFLTNKPHVAVKGTVKLDGAPLPHGTVILTPVDDSNAPPIICYVMNTDTALAEFYTHPNQVAVPGKYKVEIRQDATRWVSNNRDPVVADTRRRNELSADEWPKVVERARLRDMEPTIEDQRVFTHVHPADKGDFIVELKPAAENVLAIEVFSK